MTLNISQNWYLSVKTCFVPRSNILFWFWIKKIF